MFDDEQEKTVVDLSAQSVMWTRYMQLGKEHLAAGDSADAIRLFTLAENTVARTKDLPRQIESLTWLITAYNSLANGNGNSLLNKLMEVVEELEQKRNGQQEHKLHALALHAEIKGKYNEAGAAYSWLLASYQQRGLHSADPEVAIVLRKCDDMVSMHELHLKAQPFLLS
jgi:hypothetical protein